MHLSFSKLKTVIVAFAFSLALSANALAVMPDSLVPVGDIVGISLDAGGAIISELSEIESADGKLSPARDAGLLPGDIITAVNGENILNAVDLIACLEKITDGTIEVQYVRSGETFISNITPYICDGRAFIGIWIKDGIAGIGTVTFYDSSTGFFGALGHSISDTETSEILPYNTGSIYSAEITEVISGKSGNPGLINGSFSKDDSIGTITENSQVGIFGYINDAGELNVTDELPTAAKSEIKLGSASILSSVSGETKEYSIEITRIYSDYNEGRSIMIKVTDSELIALTGGIIQGMSGSPIIQDGKLIGAVTHVLVNDPTKGFGVSVEDMYSYSQTAA